MIVPIDASIVNYYSLFYPSQAYHEKVLSPRQPITFINLSSLHTHTFRPTPTEDTTFTSTSRNVHPQRR